MWIGGAKNEIDQQRNHCPSAFRQSLYLSVFWSVFLVQSHPALRGAHSSPVVLIQQLWMKPDFLLGFHLNPTAAVQGAEVQPQNRFRTSESSLKCRVMPKVHSHRFTLKFSFLTHHRTINHNSPRSLCCYRLVISRSSENISQVSFICIIPYSSPSGLDTLAVTSCLLPFSVYQMSV